MSFKRFSFFVPGHPATAGSKKAFVNKKTGKAVIVDNCKAGPSWRDTVQAYAIDKIESTTLRGTLIDEPVELMVVFYTLRPRSHFSKGKKNFGMLKPDAPNWPTGKPDITKMLRAIEDALKEVIWRDDALVVVQSARKVYADRPGALVTILPPGYPSDYEAGQIRQSARMQANMDGLTDSDGT